MQRVGIIDSHTGGEPTRMMVSGFPALQGKTVAEKCQFMRDRYDQWRKACVLEPRGHCVLVGALLCEPTLPEAVAGVIFFNNTGYLGMCGHGLIGVVTSLAWLGRIEPGMHVIETPVGAVTACLHDDGSVSVQNVPSYRYLADVSVDVPGFGSVTGDVAWGGNWFFLIQQHGQQLEMGRVEALTAYAWAVRQALQKAKITGAEDAEIDHIELFSNQDGGVHRNFVLCPGKAYDRSPCGTGTSAKIACLAADNALAEGEIWEQTSIVGSRFQASYQKDAGKIVPTIRGKAYVSGENSLIFEKDDPFYWGINLC